MPDKTKRFANASWSRKRLVRKKQALSAASGVTDDGLLDKLVALNLQGDALAALSQAPLVLVAWADGRIDSNDQLPEQWLAEPPPITKQSYAVCLIATNSFLAMSIYSA